MIPTDPENSNRNSEEKPEFQIDWGGKTAKFNLDALPNSQAADACFDNYTKTIHSSGEISAAEETSQSQNDDDSYQTTDSPSESENQDFDDEMKKDKDKEKDKEKKRSKEAYKPLDRKPKLGDFSDYGQKAEHKKEKKKFLFDNNKDKSDEPAAIRPKPKPTEKSEAESVDKPIERTEPELIDKPIEKSEAESVDKQEKNSLLGAIDAAKNLVYTGAKNLVDSGMDYLGLKSPFSPEAPVSPECTPVIQPPESQKDLSISAMPESDLDSNPAVGSDQPPVNPEQTPLKQQQKSKPEIFNNKWNIQVEDSKEFNEHPCLSYDDIRNFITKNQDELVNWLQQLVDNDKTLPMPLRPTSPEHKNDKFIRVAPDDIKGKNIIFVGDVHGDLLSLTSILKTAGFDPYSANDDADPDKTVIVLLGDLFDRVSDSFEVFFTVLWCIHKYGNIVWLSGNHDTIGYDESTDTFIRSTKPSDYADWLNAPNGVDLEMHPLACHITKLYSKLMGSLPAALYFPDGLLVSHGGFPHPNWYKFIQKWQDFGNSDFVRDFYWKRVHETKRRAAFCNSTSGQLGIKDFYNFCCLLNNIFKSPVSAFLRGHDHYPERVKVFDAYKLPVITFNSISCTQDDCDPLGKFGYQTTPVIIKYQPTIPDDFIPNDELDELVERERLERERLERERLEQERLEQERLERERLEQERLERERLERERLERERLERERLERERLERERLEQERLERERLEQERLERERLERERLEQEQREKELASTTSDIDSGEDNSVSDNPVSEENSKLEKSSESDPNTESLSCQDNGESASDDKVEAKSDLEASDQSIPISVFEVNPSDDDSSKPETHAEPATDSTVSGWCDTVESSDGKADTESKQESAEKEAFPPAVERTKTVTPSKVESTVVPVPAAVSPVIPDEDPPTPTIPNIVINRITISRKLLDEWYPEK